MEYVLKDLIEWNEVIESKAKELGLNFYPQEFEIIGFNEMLGYEAYVGMPSRYPHWSFGKSYEKNKTLYSFNLTGLPYEMVINSNPCLAYLMRENTLPLQILTMAHVYGHNDFFKNNRLFKEGTRAKLALEMFKLDGEIIREYINAPGIGYEKVERILDAAHAIRYNIGRVIGRKEITDEEIRKNRIDDYKKAIENKSILDMDMVIEEPILDKIPLEPYDDVVGFIIKYGKLEEWEKDIVRIVKRETEYFMPQIETKTMNEGWASYWHYNILKSLDLPEGLHFEFLKRHNDVVAPILGGLNPYYVGFKMFEDIERRYGKDKIFEVRDMERDASFIRRYLTQELCEELNLFQYGKKSFDYVIEEVSDEGGWKEIRDNLAFTAGLGSIPYIRVTDLNTRDLTLTLEHVYDGRELEATYAKETLKYVQQLWGYKVRLLTKNKDNKEFYINCDVDKKITVTESNK
ncbi:SpoVR family protein [Clostridium paraputrificum]|uniref:Stage V sporulation protein R n=1 Tax=Clostridium paraputrificum TaxID=29363 RepID=A0A1B8RKF1_9CLOT|nr:MULTISPECIES: SpoVR family protein [Clostridium]MDB2090858.1 SpoVR family protein [Clostridium paraputrificum]MDB2097484.1 SpoVR family protein [Clostridium paraputrificum]MDU1180947.1 SpoVR family protein [Clostridium sp.]MDU1227874.1 SpoVR family protein [Clostridium sp.]MDU1587113.1 SpoVR family protein [Clostridium sp.]